MQEILVTDATYNRWKRSEGFSFLKYVAMRSWKSKKSIQWQMQPIAEMFVICPRFERRGGEGRRERQERSHGHLRNYFSIIGSTVLWSWKRGWIVTVMSVTGACWTTLLAEETAIGYVLIKNILLLFIGFGSVVEDACRAANFNIVHFFSMILYVLEFFILEDIWTYLNFINFIIVSLFFFYGLSEVLDNIHREEISIKYVY